MESKSLVLVFLAGLQKFLDVFQKKGNLDLCVNLLDFWTIINIPHPSTSEMKPINMTHFARLCGLVKGVKRTGWTRYLKEPDVESVADHSCRIAMLTMALKFVEKIDQRKCLEMALIHDIGEGIVGDFTPHDKIT